MKLNLTKTDQPNYYIDKTKNIVINKNSQEYEDYKLKIQQAKEIQNLKNEISEMKNGFSELKELLIKALG